MTLAVQSNQHSGRYNAIVAACDHEMSNSDVWNSIARLICFGFVPCMIENPPCYFPSTVESHGYPDHYMFQSLTGNIFRFFVNTKFRTSSGLIYPVNFHYHQMIQNKNYENAARVIGLLAGIGVIGRIGMWTLSLGNVYESMNGLKLADRQFINSKRKSIFQNLEILPKNERALIHVKKLQYQYNQVIASVVNVFLAVFQYAMIKTRDGCLSFIESDDQNRYSRYRHINYIDPIEGETSDLTKLFGFAMLVTTIGICIFSVSRFCIQSKTAKQQYGHLSPEGKEVLNQNFKPKFLLNHVGRNASMVVLERN